MTRKDDQEISGNNIEQILRLVFFSCLFGTIAIFFLGNIYFLEQHRKYEFWYSGDRSVLQFSCVLYATGTSWFFSTLGSVVSLAVWLIYKISKKTTGGQNGNLK